MLEPFCNQTVNLKTDSKTLYYSILKLKYIPSPSILKHNYSVKLNDICTVKQQL